MKTIKVFWIGKDFFSIETKEHYFKLTVSPELLTKDMQPVLRTHLIILVATFGQLRRYEKAQIKNYEILDGE